MLVRRQEARVCQGSQRSTSSEGTITRLQYRTDIQRPAIFQAAPIRRQGQQHPSALGLGVSLAEIKLTVRTLTCSATQTLAAAERRPLAPST
jgi:hypothetical protein